MQKFSLQLVTMRSLIYLFLIAAAPVSAQVAAEQKASVPNASAAEPVRINAAPSPIRVRPASAEEKPSLSVYPNPASKEVTIKYSLPGNAASKLTLHDVNGALKSTIWSGNEAQGKHEIKWDVSHLTSGSYILGLVYGSEQRSEFIRITK
jgi:hypothetical protein